MAHEEGPKKSLSGLSVATTVAAGVAALILDFSRQPEGRIEPVTQRLLHTPEGMRTIFRYLSSGRGAHGFVAPWRLFDGRKEAADIGKMLEMILKRDALASGTQRASELGEDEKK